MRTRLTGLSQIFIVLVIIWFLYPILKELRRFVVEEFHLRSGFTIPASCSDGVIVVVSAILASIQNNEKTNK
jgi:hypothetical protein